MVRQLREEEVMTIQVLQKLGCSDRAIARQLRIHEKTVRYHLKRIAEGTPDGRAGKPFRAEVVAESIAHWLDSQESGINLRLLHEYLVREHDYAGSYKSIQRYVRRYYPGCTGGSTRKAST